MQDLNHEAIIINNNPETVSTDFDTLATGFIFDPLTTKQVSEILLRESADGILFTIRRTNCNKSSLYWMKI